MAIIDIIKWEINNNDVCYRYPSDNISIGAQLIVYPGQTAFFVKGGKICDCFSQGSHTIQSDNIPILDNLINLPFESESRGTKSPFKAEVWFVSTISRLDLKWGTPSPLQLEDPKYNIIVPVSAYGQYGVHVSDPRIFLETLIGNMPNFTVTQIESYFKGKLLSSLNSAIAQKISEDAISILDINAQLGEISAFCEKELNNVFARYGISIIEFSIISINFPENDPSIIKFKDAKDMAARLKITGKDVYQMERSYDILEKAASNEGTGGQMLAMGAGLGVGMGVGNIMGNMAEARIGTGIQSPPPINQETYFIYTDGKQIGGLSEISVCQLIHNGEANAMSLAWKPGMQDWASLGSFSEFKKEFDKNPIIPPPLPDKEQL